MIHACSIERFSMTGSGSAAMCNIINKKRPETFNFLVEKYLSNFRTTKQSRSSPHFDRALFYFVLFLQQKSRHHLDFFTKTKSTEVSSSITFFYDNTVHHSTYYLHEALYDDAAVVYLSILLVVFR